MPFCSNKISEIEQNDVTNDVKGQKRYIVSKKYFARLFFWLFWKTLLLINILWKSSWVAKKGDQVVKVSSILQNDVNKWHHMSKTGHGIEKFFSQNVDLVLLNNFPNDQYFIKTILKCLK